MKISSFFFFYSCCRHKEKLFIFKYLNKHEKIQIVSDLLSRLGEVTTHKFYLSCVVKRVASDLAPNDFYRLKFDK